MPIEDEMQDYADFGMPFEVMHVASVGLLLIKSSGDIERMNAFASQYLMPFYSDCSEINFFKILEPSAPELKKMADEFTATSGLICANHCIKIPGARRQVATQAIGLTMAKLGLIAGEQKILITITDQTEALTQEEKISLRILRKIVHEKSNIELDDDAYGSLTALADRVIHLLQENEARRKQLEQANEEKRSFLRTMSHEIRTPLNVLLGCAQVLERTPLATEQHEILSDISQSGQLLLNQINDVLDFSKIEAGQMELECRPFSLKQMLRGLESLMGNLARSKGLVLRMEGWQDLDRMLLGDSVRLSQVLMNLIGNAIKFTEQGSVVVRVEVQNSQEQQKILNFSVTDTGIGIEPEQQAHVFEAFKQSDSSINRRYGGTGLGLSICKHMVKLMNGSIGLLSRPGHGSTFWFTIPYVFGEIEASELAAPSSEAPSSAQPLKNRHILVADDNEMNRLMLKRMLIQEGATVSLAENGLQAVQAVKEAPQVFDVVLMDVQMPVMDGLTAIEWIRKNLVPNTLPVLACSAGVHSQDYFNALAAGASGFVVKPIMRESLLEKLKSIFSIAIDSKTNELSARIPVDAEAQVWPIIDGIDSLALQGELEGDLELFITLLTGLQKTLQEALLHLPREIHQAHDQANSRLHKLRGSLGCVYAKPLIDSCLRLEDSIKADDVCRTSVNWQQLAVELELLIENMERGLLDCRPPTSSAPADNVAPARAGLVA